MTYFNLKLADILHHSVIQGSKPPQRTHVDDLIAQLVHLTGCRLTDNSIRFFKVLTQFFKTIN